MLLFLLRRLEGLNTFLEDVSSSVSWIEVESGDEALWRYGTGRDLAGWSGDRGYEEAIGRVKPLFGATAPLQSHLGLASRQISDCFIPLSQIEPNPNTRLTFSHPQGNSKRCYKLPKPQ
jgi:hypothetical protein